jgi:hypothetical protein
MQLLSGAGPVLGIFELPLPVVMGLNSTTSRLSRTSILGVAMPCPGAGWWPWAIVRCDRDLVTNWVNRPSSARCFPAEHDGGFAPVKAPSHVAQKWMPAPIRSPSPRAPVIRNVEPVAMSAAREW